MADRSNRIQPFRLQFAEGLPARLERLHGHWSEAQQTGRRDAAIQAFHREAHNLAGSSAAFGYRELQEVAAELTALARRMAEGEAEPAAHRPQVSQCLGALASAIDKDEGRLGRTER